MAIAITNGPAIPVVPSAAETLQPSKALCSAAAINKGGAKPCRLATQWS